MNGFYERIVSLCEARGLTVRQLERNLGYSNSYFLNTEKRGADPSYKRMDQIADYFGVSRDFLLGVATVSTVDAVKIPLLGRVAAGMPLSAVENVIGQEEIRADVAKQGEHFALRIRGDSMSPYILDGDVVICRRQEDADSGDIVIALVNGDDGVCKRLRKSGGSIMLISNNPAYDPMLFTEAEIDSTPVQIIGKVVEIRRSL
jgi:repressor LexA